MKHQWLKYFNVYINHDPVMTFTKFMARSTWVAYAFELGKLLKCHLKGKASRKLAKDRILKIQKKENGPKASSAPALELNTIIFIHVYWYMQQISGERLQDHWSSGLCFFSAFIIVEPDNTGHVDNHMSGHCSNCTADQHLCFRYMASTIPLLSKAKNSSFRPSSEAAQIGLC